jgi:hypothetical protein
VCVVLSVVVVVVRVCVCCSECGGGEGVCVILGVLTWQ